MKLTIGKLAKESDTSVQAIRYYERQGLLDTPERDKSGYRKYDQSVVSRLEFIYCAQKLGFTLREIRELIRLQTDELVDIESVKDAAEDKLKVVTQKTEDLMRMRTALENLIRSCEVEGGEVDRRIIESLFRDNC